MDRKWKKKEKRNGKQQQEKRREMSICQGILRKSSQWFYWDVKVKRRVRKKTLKKEEKREKKKVEIQEKEEQLMLNLDEAVIMSEENWVETTKMRKNLKKLKKKFVK